MAIFNTPLPQPDHAERAVETALALKAHIDEYHQSLPEDHPHRFVSFGFGTYTGQAIVGYTGTEKRYTYTAMGKAINVAAHLAKSAQVSQVVIGEATYEKVKEFVTTNPLPPVMVKDEPDPIPAYSVVRQVMSVD